MSTKLKITIIGILVVGITSTILVVSNKSDERSYYKTEVEYVADVNEEVTLLEEEMMKLEFEVKAGTITPEKATLAKSSIVARVQNIKSNAQVAKGTTLTPAMREALNDALDRLAKVLVTYRDSLVKVEALSRTDKKEKMSGGRNNPIEITEEGDLLDLVSEVVEEITVIADEDYVGGDEIMIDPDLNEEVNNEESDNVISDNEGPAMEDWEGQDSGDGVHKSESGSAGSTNNEQAPEWSPDMEPWDEESPVI